MTRDPKLGAKLRELDVPDHRPGFFEDLRLQLGELAATPEPAADAVPLRRRGWKRNALRLTTVAAAATVIGVAIGVGVGPDGGPTRPRTATAAEVTQRVQSALGAVRTLRGELVFRSADQAADPSAVSEVRYSFVTDDTGSFRLRGLTRQDDLAYDAATGVERGYSIDPDGTAYAGERRNLGLGYPDQGPADWVLQREVGATVRALVAASDTSVREVQHDGRDAWQLETSVRANALSDLSGDHLQITVDQRTGLPVRVVESRQGRFLRELSLEHLVVDGPVSVADFTLTVPPGVRVVVTDVGWQRTTTDGAARLAGYSPLRPSSVPEGFELRHVAYAQDAGPTGVEGSNPPSRRAVALQYRRGLDVLLVTTRLRDVPGGVPVEARARCGRACLDGSQWTDPMASGEGFVDDPEQLIVTGGSLDGSPAQLLVDPRVTPHLWALTDDLVVTVSGDLSRAELLSVAASLAG